MGKGIAAGIIIAILAGGALGYGLTYILSSPGTIVQTQFTSFRTLALINQTSTSPVQVSGTQLSITTGGASYLVVRFTTAYVIYLYPTHNGLTQYQVNLTMNGETICIQYVESSSDGAVGTPFGLESGGGLILEFVTQPLPAGTYIFKIMWRSMISGGSVASQCIFCKSNFNSTRSFFIQEIHI